MGLYDFKPRFVPFIKRGDKTHTIRKVRKDGYVEQPGNTMYLYTGLRTKKAKKFAEVECVKVESIQIEMRRYSGKSVLCQGLDFPHVIIDGQDLDGNEKESLARRDGFESFADMLKFWVEPRNRLPFDGHIIHWKQK